MRSAKQKIGSYPWKLHATKPRRIKRYNEIYHLTMELPKHTAVFEESTVNVRGELQKLNLVIKDHNKIFVVDIMVRYKDKNYIRNVFREKIRKYKEIAEYIRVKINGLKVKVIPIVGCKGAIPKDTKQNIKLLGLSCRNVKTASLISSSALQSKLQISSLTMNKFCD